MATKTKPKRPKAKAPAARPRLTGGARPSGMSQSDYQQNLRDPNKRKNLPDSALTPGQRTQRRVRKRREADNKNPLYQPTRGLSGADLASAARGLADSEIRPQLGALDRESADTQRQGQALMGRIAGYGNDQGARDAQTTAQTQAIAAQLNQSLAGISGETQNKLAANAQTEQDRVSADAQIRGAGLDGGTAEKIAGEAAAQQAAALGAGQAYRSTGAMQGAATSALTANNAIAAGMQNRETLSQTGNRVGNALADISGRRTDVESTRGGLEAKNVLGLRQSEFENAVVGQELDLKAAGVAVDAASAEAKAKGDADSKRQEFIAKYGVSPERWRGMSPKERLSWKRKWESDGKPPPAGKVTDNYGYTDEEYGRMSPAQRRKAKARWEKAGKSSSGGKESEASNKAQANILGAESWVERYIADQNWDPSKMSDNEKKKYRGQANARGLKTLTNKDGEVTRDAFDPIVLSVALDLAFDGRISRRNIGRLEALDIKVTSDGRLA